MDDNERVAEPFKNLKDLYEGIESLSYWPEVYNLRRSTTYVYKASDFNNKDDRPERLQRDEVPKTIICHDLMGGYLEDK